MLVPQSHDTPTCARYVAHLHANGRGDRYCVTFDGKLIVSCSRDSERDDARALLVQGIAELNRHVDSSPSHWAQSESPSRSLNQDCEPE